MAGDFTLDFPEAAVSLCAAPQVGTHLILSLFDPSVQTPELTLTWRGGQGGGRIISVQGPLSGTLEMF